MQKKSDQPEGVLTEDRRDASDAAPALGGRSKPGRQELTRVLIADKNPVVRAGLGDYISRDGRFEVADIVSGGNAFIANCEAAPATIGIIGWGLLDMSGADVLRAVRRRKLPIRIVVYTGDASSSVLRQAVLLGAWGFISKSEDPAVLIDALASIARGRLSLPYIDIGALSEDPLEGLTTREHELLRALSNGLTNEQIASRIGISQNTVKYHLKNLYDKLGVKNRAMAVALAMSARSSETYPFE